MVEKPTPITVAGNKPKPIEEFISRVNSATPQVNVARMRSPDGWVEPGQTPEFNEYTVVLGGCLRMESKDGPLDVLAGQAVVAHAGEWIRSSSPHEDGAEYIAICLPVFFRKQCVAIS